MKNQHREPWVSVLMGAGLMLATLPGCLDFERTRPATGLDELLTAADASATLEGDAAGGGGPAGEGSSPGGADPLAAPSIATVTVLPSAPVAGDTLVCSWSGYAHPTGGEDASLVSWSVNDAPSMHSGTELDSGFRGGDVVRCTVTPFDGERAGEPVSGEVSVVNTPPVLKAVHIEPESPRADDALTCSWSGWEDPDGDLPLVQIAWLFEGAVIADAADLQPGAFVRGDELTCAVTPFDGTEGETATASVTIQNSAPSVETVVVTPAEPTAESTLTCSYEGFFDLDGDADQSVVEWRRGEELLGTEPTLADAFSEGDPITCRVLPRDDSEFGAQVEASVVVGNAPPSASGAVILPAHAVVGTELSCVSKDYFDPDLLDTDSSTIEWFVNGGSVSTAPTLVAPHKGSEVTCVLTPSDGDATGPSVSASLIVGNSAPSATGVQLTPSSPTVGTPVTCAVVGFEDADSDPDESGFVWFVAGELLSSDSVLAAAPPKGTELTCVATPHDGEAPGTPVEGSVVVANTLPELGGVSIQPAAPTVADVPTCGAVSMTDADDDPLTAVFSWKVNGEQVHQGPALDSGFSRGDVLECVGVPHDGLGQGAPVTASLTVANAPPTLDGVEMVPAAPVTGDEIGCAPLDFHDPDGDSDASMIEWKLGTEAVGQGAVFPLKASRGDQVSCRVTPHDGVDAGQPATVTATVGNAAPVASHVTITPETPQTGQPLTCSVHGFADPEGDPDASSFAWTVAGEPAGMGPVLPSGALAGQEAVCTVAVSDGADDGPTLTVAVTVINSPPELEAVAITPESPRVGDVVSCLATGYSDPDDDPDKSVTTWFINDAEVDSGTTLSAPFVRGDILRCVATPFDGLSAGEPVVAEVVVANSPPSLESASIDPAVPVAASTITCLTSGWSDPDGDLDDSLVSWFVNDQPAGTGAVLKQPVVGGDQVRCEVVPFDGQEGGAVVWAIANVENSPPSASGLVVTPLTPVAGDSLSCAVSGFHDPDGQADQSILSWTVNGELAGTGAELAVPLVHGDLVTCGALLWDGMAEGGEVSTQVVVGNTPPSLTGAAVSPQSPKVGEELTCETVGFFDADGEEEASTFEWLIGGAVVATGPTYPAAPERGVTVQCRVTPSDTHAEGAPASYFVTVANTPPSIDSAAIDPVQVFAGDTPTCASAGWWDGDDDLDQSMITWERNDQPAGSGPVLGVPVVHGDELVCEITPFDGQDIGTPRTATVAVSNTPPSVAEVWLDPPAPVAGESVTCGWSGYHDADGEADQSTVEWQVGATTFDGPVLPSSAYSIGDALVCVVTPHDGHLPGAPVTKVVVVGNTPPTIGGVQIDPLVAHAGTELTCTYSGYQDAEGSPDQSSIQWFVNGQSAGGTPTLATGFVGGDTVTCQVTPNDGLSDGETSSAQVLVANTAPTLTSAAIGPEVVRAGDPVQCSWQGFFDADGQADQTTVAWSLNGAPGPVGPNWAGPWVRGDIIECEATASDGVDAGDVATATITVANTPPSITGASLDPPAPRDTDTITCLVSGYSDPDGDGDASQIAWFVNDVAAGEGAELDGGFVGGDRVRCVVTAHDGYGAGNLVSAEVEVVSTVPTISSAGISPSHPTVVDELTCTWGGFEAIDAGPDLSIVKWYVGVELVGTGSTLSAGYERGDTVSCSVTPYDGLTAGEPLVATTSIFNAPPQILSVSIEPAAPGTDSEVTAVVEAEDPDGDPVELTHGWSVNGGQALCSGSTCSGIVAFDKGQVLRVAVTPSDGDLTGATVTSVPVTVANSAPGAPVIGFTESTASPPGQDIECVIVTVAPDLDGDVLTYEYSWLVDGAASTVEAATVPSEIVEAGETWTCVVQATDGEAMGPAVEVSIPVGTAWTADISEDADWVVEGSPYVLGADITVFEDRKLTIDEGVEVFGQGHTLYVRRHLVVGAADTNKPMATVYDLHVVPEASEESSVEVEIRNTHWIGGAVLPVGLGPEQTDKVKLLDSVFTDVQSPIVIAIPEAECQIYRNVFVRSGGLSVTVDSAAIKLKNNVWFEQLTPALEKWSGPSGKIEFKDNSFLSMDRLAASLPAGASGGLVANDNYWSTQDQTVVDEMVFDKLDDLASPGVVVVTSLAAEPHQDTPDPGPYLP